MKNYFPVILLIGVFAGLVTSRPDEVPLSPQVCESMTPGHGPPAQESPAPFSVHVSTKSIHSGEKVKVSLKGKADFKGFYLQARKGDEVHAIGSFINLPKYTKVHNCLSGQNNSIFHGSRGSRNNLELTWESPKDFKGDVNFLATFVESYAKFWVKVRGDSKITVT